MKTKLLAIIAVVSATIISVNAQDADLIKKLNAKLVSDTLQGWKTGGVLTVNLAQTSLTNWVAGGQNSVAVNGLMSAFANLSKGKSRWDNNLDIGYGVLKQKGDAFPSRKTDDKIEFVSKYGRQAFDNIFYSGLMNFKTQTAPGYNYVDATTRNKISDAFAPAYLLFALGLDYKPGTHLSVFLAPVTEKYTFVNDNALSAAGAFGVTPGKKVLSEFGGYFRAIYTKNDFLSEFMKNVTLISKLDLFSNYTRNPQNIAVSWENIISLKVNKFIAATINTHLLYDDKIKVPHDRNGNGIVEPGETVGSKVQFKEILGVGLSYNFK
jgi:hypothetical protein